VARKAGIHPTIALRQATEKFIKRFEAMEQMAEARHLDMGALGLEKLDRLWDEAKTVV